MLSTVMMVDILLVDAKIIFVAMAMIFCDNDGL